MDVVVERAVDRATAVVGGGVPGVVGIVSSFDPESIARAVPGTSSRVAISATPAASIPFCAATNPNATRNPSNPTRKLPGGHARERHAFGADLEPGVEQLARLGTGPNETRPSSWGAPARRSRLHRARRRTARRRVEARRRPRGSRRERRNRDETRRSRDETRTRDANWNAFQFSRVSVSQNAARRCRAQSARVNSSSRSWTWVMFPRSRSSDASRDARKIAAALRVR